MKGPCLFLPRSSPFVFRHACRPVDSRHGQFFLDAAAVFPFVSGPRARQLRLCSRLAIVLLTLSRCRLQPTAPIAMILAAFLPRSHARAPVLCSTSSFARSPQRDESSDPELGYMPETWLLELASPTQLINASPSASSCQVPRLGSIASFSASNFSQFIAQSSQQEISESIKNNSTLPPSLPLSRPYLLGRTNKL